MFRHGAHPSIKLVNPLLLESQSGLEFLKGWWLKPCIQRFPKYAINSFAISLRCFITCFILCVRIITHVIIENPAWWFKNHLTFLDNHLQVNITLNALTQNGGYLRKCYRGIFKGARLVLSLKYHHLRNYKTIICLRLSEYSICLLRIIVKFYSGDRFYRKLTLLRQLLIRYDSTDEEPKYHMTWNGHFNSSRI